MRHFYSLLVVVALAVVSALPVQAAFTKISDLFAITSPSTNTWIEVADMAAATKSRKYLLTNLALTVYADVRNYGALMNGSDDTAALQAAVNSGRVALVPAGTLTYTGTISMKSGAGIVGQGVGITILRKTGHGIGIKVDGTNNTTRLTDTILSGFTLQGDSSAFAGDYGIVYHHANDQHRIENVEIRECGDVGLFFKGDCFEIRGHNLEIVSNLGADQILFQETPDAGAEDANDITLNKIYVLPAASTRVLHFTNSCNGNIIGPLIIQSPAPEVEAISFDGVGVKNNWLRGVFAYDQVATNGASAFVIFNNASENIIDGFNGGMTGIPVFDFKTNAVRNVILNGTKSASPTFTAKTDAGSTQNAIINWQGNNSTMLTADSVAPVSYTWANTLDYSTLRGNTLTLHGGSITASTPSITSTSLWNNAGVTFKNLTFDVTDTASGSGSTLLEMTVGGAQRFTFYKTGAMLTSGGITGNFIETPASQIQLQTYGLAAEPGTVIGWRSGHLGAYDTRFERVSGNLVKLTSDGASAYGTLRANIEGTTGVFTNGVTAGASTFTGTVSGTALSITNMVFHKTRVIRQALTHAGGTITLNMATNVPGNATCTLTGAVTFASSNLIDGSQYDLIFFSSGASNSITWGPEFRFAGYKPGSIAATNSAGLATMGHLWAEANGTNLLCTYAEEQ